MARRNIRLKASLHEPISLTPGNEMRQRESRNKSRIFSGNNLDEGLESRRGARPFESAQVVCVFYKTHGSDKT